MATKTKIILDADVIIHFMKADRLVFLLDIFPEYTFVILNVVYDEVTKHRGVKTQIDNTLQFFSKRISLVAFAPTGESIREYARLTAFLGRGESACMVYCRDNKDVLGSSNLRDIKEYCKGNDITYLTTLDFLYYAFVRGKMTAKECEVFVDTVISKGSRLPQIDISTYVCEAQI